MTPDLPTDPERWRQIETLLDEAFERPAGERRTFLDEACAGDLALRAQMESLLIADEKAGDFLAAPSQEAAAALLADDSQDSVHLPDRTLGPYRLIREIGAGGMGVVYEAEDTRLRRRVAVKVLPPEYSRDPAAKQRFVREARAAAALDHPNICTVHDIGDTDGQLYIVMACYEGETLKARLERGPLPVDEARQVAIQVARGLAHAHEAGIVHRDVKSANVLLTRRGEAKILDFGIAKTRSDTTLTRTGGSPGTPAYMSPEQAQGRPVDARTDLWSLGVLLYEMLAGRRPFAGGDEQAVLYAIQSREPEPLLRVRTEVPRALDGAVAKALAKNPDDRYQSAAEILADLETGRTPAAPRGRWQASRPATWLPPLVGAGVLAAVALAVWWFILRVPTIRVAILRPVVTPTGEVPGLPFVAPEVVEAAVGTLASLEGVQTLDPPDFDEKSGSKAEQQRAAEADEVLRSVLSCQPDSCLVTFRRLQGSKRFVKATVGPFEVPTGTENARRLAEGVGTYLRRLFRDHRPRPETPEARVRDQDYAAFVQIERRSERGESLGTKDLDRLDDVLRRSPGLLAANLLAAGIARGVRDLGRATNYAEQARALAPFDPRPLFERFRIEVAGDRLEEAQATLLRLKSLAPDDVRVQIAEAELLAARGKLEEAHRQRQEIVRRRPTWRNVLGLANLEVRLGESETASRRLHELLEEQPTNRRELENLAAFELQYIDIAAAVRIYNQLIGISPEYQFFLNLGFARYLLRDYPAAVAADHQALRIKPDYLLSLFNLATAQEAQGNQAEARDLYRSLLKRFESLPGQPDSRTRMLKAQCLVRLGRHDEAAQLAEKVLKQPPEEVQVLHQAAQLYALLGERADAVHYAKQALKKGLRREWFTIPEFNSLSSDPEFKALLDAHASRRPVK